MIIRQATEVDIIIITELGLKFVAEFPDYFPFQVSCEDFATTTLQLIAGKTGEVLVAESTDGIIVGVLIAMIQPMFYNVTQWYAQELLFYVLPEYRHSSCGTQLADQAELWAQTIGAYGMGFGSLPGTGLENFYRSRGCIKRETHFSKVF